MLHYDKKLKQFWHNLRNKITDAERPLWSRLWKKQHEENRESKEFIFSVIAIPL